MTPPDSTRSERTASGARRLAVIAAIGAAVVAFWASFPWLDRLLFVGDFEFVPLDEPPGFRRITTGEVSGGWDPLTGVTGAAEAISLEPGDFCRALFRSGAFDADVVPIAYFTDYRCPYCRVLSQRLAALEQDHPQVRVAWHEWPVLGDASVRAARAALAAKRQDAYADFHERLMRTSFVPNPAYLRSISERIGVDPDRLLADMVSAGVEQELDETRALAAIFGFRGTPGLVVGRTVVFGAIEDAPLRALVEREIADGPSEVCQAGG